MLNLLPELLTYEILVPLIFRLFLGFYLVTKSINHYKQSRKIFGLSEFTIGGFLILGLFTQIAAFIFFLGLLNFIYTKRICQKKGLFNFYTLLLIVSLSLIFLGAGFWAIDLPL